MVVTIDEVEDSAFDVPLTQLDIDNSRKRFTVRLFCNEGGYQKIIGGDDLRSRNPEVEDNSSSDSGEGDRKTVQQSTWLWRSEHSGDRGSRQQSITPHHQSSAFADNSEQKDNIFPAKISKQGKYGYEVEFKSWSNGLMVQQ
jgi:hypothetical protein